MSKKDKQLVNVIQNAKQIINVMDNVDSVIIKENDSDIKIEIKREAKNGKNKYCSN